MLPDLTFEFAALLFTRVLSASTPGYVTFDLGNKAIAADPPGERGRFLAIDQPRTLIHNEEHWLLAVSPDLRFRVGDEHYVVPTHVCPCVALHRQFYAVLRGAGRQGAGKLRGDGPRPSADRLTLAECLPYATQTPCAMGLPARRLGRSDADVGRGDTAMGDSVAVPVRVLQHRDQSPHLEGSGQLA